MPDSFAEYLDGIEAMLQDAVWSELSDAYCCASCAALDVMAVIMPLLREDLYRAWTHS